MAFYANTLLMKQWQDNRIGRNWSRVELCNFSDGRFSHGCVCVFAGVIVCGWVCDVVCCGLFRGSPTSQKLITLENRIWRMTSAVIWKNLRGFWFTVCEYVYDMCGLVLHAVAFDLTEGVCTHSFLKMKTTFVNNASSTACEWIKWTGSKWSWHICAIYRFA